MLKEIDRMSNMRTEKRVSILDGIDAELMKLQRRDKELFQNEELLAKVSSPINTVPVVSDEGHSKVILSPPVVSKSTNRRREGGEDDRMLDLHQQLDEKEVMMLQLQTTVSDLQVRLIVVSIHLRIEKTKNLRGSKRVKDL